MKKNNLLLNRIVFLLSKGFTPQTYLFVIATVFTISTSLTAQTTNQQKAIQQQSNTYKLRQLAKISNEKAAQSKKEAMTVATSNGWDLQVYGDDGSFSELQSIAADGSPIYYTTYNTDAAASTRTNHLNIGGSLGLNLDGQNMTAHVWDGGHPRASHQEYDGPGGNNRVSVRDANSEGGVKLNFHAAHVTGTIMASGVQSAAKGMAPQAKARCYMWNNDVSEATAAAADGMLISNHSYGFRGDLVPDQYFGAYITTSASWDRIMFNAPYYLMVVAAGNDGNRDEYNAAPLSGNSKFDKLTGHSTSKNNLVVANAQDANVAANGDLISVTINSSSSEGPTDDFRIKPDITGNGTGLYSTYEGSDTDYASITGTSMASPNVSGSLLLLQQHYNNINGNFMRAATLKGVALHTADDIGPSGPDAVHGWGLLNAKAAATTISNSGNQSIVDELTIANGQSYTINVTSDGSSPLLASISWTDRPGSATSATNSSTPVLVNDLDIRVTKNGTTYTPYRLTGVNSNGKGDNKVDPYERIDIGNASGTYTITVTHKGSLNGGSQNFSLIITGLTPTTTVCTADTPSNVRTSSISATSATIDWDVVTGTTYEVRYRQSGATSWTTKAAASNTYSISGLSPNTAYEAQVRSLCSNGTASAFSSSTNITTTDQQISYCSSNGQSVTDEYIQNVKLAEIDNTSGASSNGYADFTGAIATLTKGSENTITITPRWTGSVYNEGYAVWIDYNKDGDFIDAGELVWSQSPTRSSSVSGTFTIPNQAIDGSTRMRVSMKYNAIPSSCESFQYGEVEDYTVSIGSTGADTQAPTTPTNLTASNIEKNQVSLSWNAATDNVGVTEYIVYQGADRIGSLDGTSAIVNQLTASTTYQFSIKAIDAAGNLSGASNVVTVTTAGNSTCTSGIASFPYAQGFENTLGTWTQSTADDIDWTVSSRGTPSNGTGPSGANQGSYYIYVEASGSNVGFPNKQAILNSPCYDLSGLTKATFSFDYHMHGDNNMGSIALEISNDNGGTWTSIWRETGTKQNSWLTASLDISTYAGQSIKLRFNRVTGNTWKADIAIDNLRLSDSKPSTDICQGVPAWSSSKVYPRGSTVVYQGNLYEKVLGGWKLIGPCGTTSSFTTRTDELVQGPPVNDQLSVYPNPIQSGNLLKVNLTQEVAQPYQILDVLGKIIQQGSYTETIDTYQLGKGMYLLKVGTQTTRFVIK